MKKYSCHPQTMPEEVAHYAKSKIKHHYNEAPSLSGNRLRYRDQEVKVKKTGLREIKLEGDEGKLLGWVKNVLSKPSSPVD